jgi:hypothetical protein
MNKTLLLGVLALVLGGCSSVSYRCALGQEGGTECRSMHQSYDAAVRMPELPMAAGTPAYAMEAAAQGGVQGQFEGYPQPRQVGMPVYEAAKVHRAWTAPWTDAEGNLRGGEYVYFTTPGKWSYGGLRSPGEASDIFRPKRADDVGMAVISPLEAAANAARGAAPAATQPVSTPTATRQVPVAPAPSGITQPYQKLTTSDAPSAN